MGRAGDKVFISFYKVSGSRIGFFLRADFSGEGEKTTNSQSLMLFAPMVPLH